MDAEAMGAVASAATGTGSERADEPNATLGCYTFEYAVPDTSGEYSVTVTAYDAANEVVSEATVNVTVAA